MNHYRVQLKGNLFLPTCRRWFIFSIKSPLIDYPYGATSQRAYVPFGTQWHCSWRCFANLWGTQELLLKYANKSTKSSQFILYSPELNWCVKGQPMLVGWPDIFFSDHIHSFCIMVHCTLASLCLKWRADFIHFINSGYYFGSPRFPLKWCYPSMFWVQSLTIFWEFNDQLSQSRLGCYWNIQVFLKMCI